MWRWWVSVGLTAFAIGLALLLGAPYGSSPNEAPLTLSWLVLMVLASPTILYYRLLIYLGERLIRPRPAAGAALFVLAGALLPPFIYNLRAERTLPRDFVQAPPPYDTVAIEQTYPDQGVSREGVALCYEPCLRLLYGGGARRVVLGDSSPETDNEARSGDHSRTVYASAQVLRVERRDTCPPVATVRSRDDVSPAAPRVGPSSHRDRHPNVDDRVLALIADGHCLVAEPGAFRNAQLRLGIMPFAAAEPDPPAPGGGLIGGRYSFVDRREGRGWRRISRRIDDGWYVRWLYPFAFVPLRHSWFAGTVSHIGPPPQTRDREMPWAWAGIDFPTPRYIGRERVRSLLREGLDLPAGAARDARHLLAWQYLEELAARPLDPVDRALLPRLIADPRIPANDLHPLRGIAHREQAGPIGLGLAERIGRTDPEGSDLRTLSALAATLPRTAWPTLLPRLRRIAADPDRAGNLDPDLFNLFAAGDAGDAATLVGLFRDNWHPNRHGNPLPRQFRAEAEARDGRARAYLVGLCALADKSDEIRPALIEASRTANLNSGFRADNALWETMARMNVPVERLTADRSMDGLNREMVASIVRRPRQPCPLQPHRAADGAVPAFGWPHDDRAARLFDRIVLLIVGFGIAAWIVLARRRARRRPAGGSDAS